MKSSVILFTYTPNMERLCAAAMRACNSPHPSYTLYSGKDALEDETPLDEERIKTLLQRAVELGHHSILEHAQLTFDLQNVSRSCTHQLVRHRIAAYSQQSQRHVKITRGEGGYVKPPSISENTRVPITISSLKDPVNLTFDDILDITRQMEAGLLERGIKAEDARYVRPNAAVTNIVTSMNARELLHVLRLRCASSAQWEIRDVAWAMLACTKLVAPSIFKNLPGTENAPAFQEKNTKLEETVDQVRPLFTAAHAGELIEIPLEQIGQEHPVQALTRKI